MNVKSSEGLHTFMYANIRGLLLKSNRSKPSILSDYLSMNNGLGLSICETWLDGGINDAEIQIENYTIFRSDRNNRERGGVASYVRNDLKCVKSFSYSNSVVEALIVKCKMLDTLFIIIYRPPDTKDEEWKDALTKIDESIRLCQANGDYKSIYIMGDFNMKNVKWDQNVMVLSQYMTSQEETLNVFLSDWCLCNYVSSATRESNIVDWILTNDGDLGW